MFASKVATYNDNALLGTRATTAQSNFEREHPLYREIAKLAALRREHVALRRGPQIVRNYDDEPGLFAASRIDPESGDEILLAFNTTGAPLEANVEIDARTQSFKTLSGACAPGARAPGSYRVSLPAFGYIVCMGMRGE
jgi:hypothetical protein